VKVPKTAMLGRLTNMQADSSARASRSRANTLSYHQRCASRRPSSTPTVSHHPPTHSQLLIQHTNIYKSTRTAKCASRSSTPRKKTSTATNPPPSAGHPSRPPRPSSSPSYPCCQAPTTSHRRTWRLRACGGTTRLNSRNG
jgi:hypothetical protein